MFGTLAIKKWLNLPPDSLVLVQKRVDRRKLHSHNHRSWIDWYKKRWPLPEARSWHPTTFEQLWNSSERPCFYPPSPGNVPWRLALYGMYVSSPSPRWPRRWAAYCYSCSKRGQPTGAPPIKPTFPFGCSSRLWHFEPPSAWTMLPARYQHWDNGRSETSLSHIEYWHSQYNTVRESSPFIRTFKSTNRPPPSNQPPCFVGVRRTIPSFRDLRTTYLLAYIAQLAYPLDCSPLFSCLLFLGFPLLGNYWVFCPPLRKHPHAFFCHF